MYQFVLLVQPDDCPAVDDEAAERLQRQHLGHFANMRDAGHLKVAGPLADRTDERLRGICIYQVGSIERARELAELDPAVRAGQLAVEIMHWYTAKGALRFEV